jgi:hypothetical protein
MISSSSRMVQLLTGQLQKVFVLTFAMFLLNKRRRSSADRKLCRRVGAKPRFTFKKFLIKEVYEQFPYMRWCDNDWKVHFLATRVYSNWLKAQRLKEARVKVKVEKKEDPQTMEPTTNLTSAPANLMNIDSAPSSTSKRKASLDASVQSPSKRARHGFQATPGPGPRRVLTMSIFI